MAIEDAVVLGQRVGEFDDVEALFTAFTARRFDRCRTILEGSVAIGQMEMDDAPFADQRALSARLGAAIRESI
jgi:2-polyprenyl-6-methoxyphenol hydroxylase-like FAD-dependent oxidoreductase